MGKLTRFLSFTRSKRPSSRVIQDVFAQSAVMAHRDDHPGDVRLWERKIEKIIGVLVIVVLADLLTVPSEAVGFYIDRAA